MTQITITKQLIENMLVYLHKYLALSNGHMVDFFTKNLFRTCIPEAIQNEINNIGYEETVRIILNAESHPITPTLNEFIATAKNFSLYNLGEVCMNLVNFKMKLKDFSHDEISSLHLDVFMKSKKSHEVETLSAIAASIKKITNTSHLIDIGDGKGYLSSLLALHHKIPVLGVDASLINTEGAVKRASKLEKHWHNILKISKDSEHYKNIDRSQLLYKQVTQFVTEDTDFDELINTIFLEKHSGLGLVGLHTCGNLGPSSIHIFNANNNIKSICNVSCCYHLLNEKYVACSTKFIESNKKDGFPMSNYLKTNNVELGRPARMLSAQSIDRILSKQELPSKIIFYRSIFEVLIKKYCEVMPTKNVGKFRKEPTNFTEYSREACKRVGVDIPVTDDDLERFYNDYVKYRIELNIFHLIRSMLAPVIESLILLDRYLFLLEQGHENVFLVKLFDPVISPRCYGLIAFKNT